MEIQKFAEFYNKIRKGTFTKMFVVSDKGNGYVKESHMVIRFVKYDHINGVQPNPNAKPNPNVKVLIPNVATYNANTGNTLISVATTNVRSKNRYLLNGKEITKEEFYEGTKSKPSQPTKWLTIKLSNIKSIG